MLLFLLEFYTLKHKTEDYKISAVEYFLISDESQTDVCKIFSCNSVFFLNKN